MISARRTRPFRAAVALLAGVILGSTLATVVSAADKTFTASVAPGALVAGASYGSGARAGSPITLTITNTSNQAQLGSANVTPPVGVVAMAATSSRGITPAPVVGGTIQLRELALAPGTSTTVNITAQVECASNHLSYVWDIVTKQANDFNGTGNDLAQVGTTTNTITGTCSIAFSKEPASSEKTPVTITSKIYDPSGAAVTITVFDGASFDTVPWWSGSITLTLGDDPSGGSAALSGGLTGSPSGGSLTFTPKISKSASDYSLVATASPTAGSASVGTSTAGVESANFDIVDDATICQSGTGCSAQAGQGNKTGAKVDAAAQGGSAGDLVILSIADPTVVVDCPGYVESSDVIEYNVTTSDGVTASNRPKVATMTLAAAFVTKSATKYDVCYVSDQDFTDKFGNLISAGDPGLLPMCANRSPQPPCVVSRVLDKQKNLVIVVSSPPGDPAGRF